MEEDNLKKDNISEWHKVLYREREILIDELREASRSFDQNMLTLSAGALGLSITFVNLIAPNPQGTRYLIYAWYFFIGSLLSTLISFLTSQSACRKQMINVDHMINDSKVELKCGWKYIIPWWMKKNKAKCKDCYSKNCWSRVTLYLNILSITLFVLGVMSFAIFAGRSLANKENQKKEENKLATQINSNQTPQSTPNQLPNRDNRGFVPQTTPQQPSNNTQNTPPLPKK